MAAIGSNLLDSMAVTISTPSRSAELTSGPTSFVTDNTLLTGYQATSIGIAKSGSRRVEILTAIAWTAFATAHMGMQSDGKYSPQSIETYASIRQGPDISVPKPGMIDQASIANVRSNQTNGGAEMTQELAYAAASAPIANFNTHDLDHETDNGTYGKYPPKLLAEYHGLIRKSYNVRLSHQEERRLKEVKYSIAEIDKADPVAKEAVKQARTVNRDLQKVRRLMDRVALGSASSTELANLLQQINGDNAVA